jgi:subtilase family serine protease
LSYPAVSPFVTAVGGTRLTLGRENTRVSEVVWNDSVFGVSGAGGGGVARREPRPAYQDGANPQSHRAVPDVSALADVVPGWPDVISSKLQTVGGTSGSTPFVQPAS